MIQTVSDSKPTSARRLCDSIRTRIPPALRRHVLLAIRRVRAAGARTYPLPVLDLAGDGQSLIPIGGDRPRALVSYLVEPFAIPEGDERFLTHASVAHAKSMVAVLNRMGYVVDAVDYRDRTFVPGRDYRLFIGHAGINFERISNRLSSETTRVYLSTGCYWKYHNTQELARLADLRARRGSKLPPDRWIRNAEEGALRAAHAIVAIGNSFTASTYSTFPRVIALDGGVPNDEWFDTDEKDYSEARNHFLYYSGNGAVHKGLDLLIEGFASLPQHLWICARLEPEFAGAYSHELANCPNIHLVGWVQARSPRFYELMSQCNWVILPSCSEGQAQSVVECMNQGLVPVVSRAAGLDTDDFGVLLEPCTVREISRTVADLADFPPERCNEMSRQARGAAVTNFSLDSFASRFEGAIARVVREFGDGTGEQIDTRTVGDATQ